MKIHIRCHSCSHRFQRTAAQVLTDGTCSKCGSTDIDLDDSMQSQSAIGEPERGLCPRCNTAQLSVATGRCSQCGYEVMSEHEVKAVDWLLEIRRLQNEDGLSFDEAKARLGRRIAALTEPNDTDGSKKCPGCNTGNYDDSSCSNCGYTPEDATKESSRRTAVLYDVMTRGSFVRVGDGPYATMAEAEAEAARLNALHSTNEYSAGVVGTDRWGNTAARHIAWNSLPTHCDYCGQEGCSPNCPGPSSRGICPDCGGGTSEGKCNDPQGCGYGWGSSDRGLTSDGEPRYAAKLNEITESVLGSNPGMARTAARSIALETIRRYPKVVST